MHSFEDFSEEKIKMITQKLFHLLTFSVALSLASSFNSVQAASFTGLGDLPGGTFYSQASGISGDGSTVVGYSRTSNNRAEAFGWRAEAFRWTESEGMIGLGGLGLNFPSVAWAVSGDGSTIVGESVSEAFRWTESEGMIGLGDLPGLNFSSQAWGISGDGSTIVGFGSGSNGSEAFRWTESEGMIGLGDLPGGKFSSQARGVESSDVTTRTLTNDSRTIP